MSSKEKEKEATVNHLSTYLRRIAMVGGYLTWGCMVALLLTIPTGLSLTAASTTWGLGFPIQWWGVRVYEQEFSFSCSIWRLIQNMLGFSFLIVVVWRVRKVLIESGKAVFAEVFFFSVPLLASAAVLVFKGQYIRDFLEEALPSKGRTEFRDDSPK
jgi:hypothetical protein